MNRLIIGSLVAIAMSILPTTSVVAMINQEVSGIVITGPSTVIDSTKIQDPYEQCLAYVKLKQIEGINCKPRTNPTDIKTGATTPSTGIKSQIRPPAENQMAVDGVIKIQDPYEQCLAYVKLKKIVGVDCKARIDAMKNSKGMGGTGTTGTGWKVNPPECMTTAGGSCGQRMPPIQEGDKRQCLVAGPGCDGEVIPNKDRSIIEFKGLIGAIERLSPSDRAELIKMIRTFLKTKNIKTPAIDLYIPRKDDVRKMDSKKEEISTFETKTQNNSSNQLQ